jgi:hypothetical protein
MSVITMRAPGGVHHEDTRSSFAFPERRWLALYNVMLPAPKKHEILFDEVLQCLFLGVHADNSI